MNKTTGIILGAIALIVIIGGGIYANSKQDVDTSANPTPASTTNTTTSTNNNTGVVKSKAPTVTTGGTAFPTDTTAILNGNVNPQGALTSYWYEFGSTSSLGNKTNNQTVGSGFVQISAPGYLTGLAKNTTYYFRLVAQNQNGNISGTVYNFKTTEGTPPPVGSAPTTKSLSASGISRTTANLNGEVTANKATTQYWFEYGKSTDLGNTSAFSSAGNGTAKTSVSISLSDLEPLTTYYFRLNAQNQFGTINGSILNFKTQGPTSAKMPSIVTDNATAVTSSGATLHGSVNPNLADTKYWFEYSTDSLLGSLLIESTDPVGVGSGGTEVSIEQKITGLNSNTTYYYHIVAQNSMGTVKDGIESFKTK